MIDDFLKVFEIAKNIDFKTNSTFEERNYLANKLYNFVINIFDDYADVFKSLMDSNVRFIDYYDSNLCSGEDIIESFYSNYVRDDVDDACELFVLYAILKKAEDFIVNYDSFDSFDDFYDCLDMGSYFDTLSYLVDFMREKKKIREENLDKKMDFLKDESKFKIFFTGHACDDIKELDPKTLKSFIGKLNTQLCCMDVIPLSEDIDHTKEGYGFQLSRIRLGDSYRIAYTRRRNVTAILGVAKKTGRDIDYTRYDSVARRAFQIYQDIDLFSLGVLPGDDPHFDTIDYLQEFSNKVDRVP